MCAQKNKALFTALLVFFGSGVFFLHQTRAAEVSCITLTQNLSHGSKDATGGGEVTRLQGFLGGPQTGYFGPITSNLVKQWQLSHNVIAAAADLGAGFVGPKTRARMQCVPASTVFAAPPVVTQTPQVPEGAVDPATLQPVSGKFSVTGSAAAVDSINIILLPASYSGSFAYIDVFKYLVSKNMHMHPLASGSYVRQGRWSAPFGLDGNIPSGSYVAAVYSGYSTDASKNTILLTKVPLEVGPQ